MANQRKKPQQPKLKKVNVSPRDQWRKILKDIDKEEIPIDLLLSIHVKLIDGTQVDIDIKDLLAQGADPDRLEQLIDERIEQLGAYIHNVDFMVSIDDVVRTVQPITDEILKDL